MVRILFVDDSESETRELAAALRALGYDVVQAPDARAAVDLLEGTGVQFIVAASRCGGAELTQELREAEDHTPILILTADNTLEEKRRIFCAGADGYLLLPAEPEELQLRVRSLLWRCRIVGDAALRFGSCTLHSQTMTLESPQGTIELRRMEFLLLEKLLSYPGRVFTRPQLMDELWGFDSQSDPRTVDTHIRRLRKKLRDVEDIRLQTVRGLGYRAAPSRRMRRNERSRGASENAAEEL